MYLTKSSLMFISWSFGPFSLNRKPLHNHENKIESVDTNSIQNLNEEEDCTYLDSCTSKLTTTLKIQHVVPFLTNFPCKQCN